MKSNQGKVKKAIILFSSIVIPCSGYVVMQRHNRGLIMLMWIFAMGYITYHLTSPEAPFLYRFSGGFAVWFFSVIEVISYVKKAD